MLIAQHIEDSPNDESLSALCEQHANQGGYFMLNLRSCPEEQDSIWDISLGFVPICLDSSGRLLKLERIFIFITARRVAEAAVESAIARFQRTGSARRWDGTFFTTWSTSLTDNLRWTARMLSESIRSHKKCARHSKPKQQLT